MEITSLLLMILGILAIASAIITVAHKEPLKSAIAMIFHFFMLAGIYLTLSAEFLAVMQLIVYAGAIMVLVLFVIMLLNVAEEVVQKNKSKLMLSVTVAGALLIVLTTYVILNGQISENNSLNAANFLTKPNGSIQTVGKELYTNFLVPLEIVGILLLSAIIGAVMVAKKQLK
jgi:NADH-quinone oxidoreductase subunit J